jgi:hypothetical protein
VMRLLRPTQLISKGKNRQKAYTHNCSRIKRDVHVSGDTDTQIPRLHSQYKHLSRQRLARRYSATPPIYGIFEDRGAIFRGSGSVPSYARAGSAAKRASGVGG